MVLIFEFFMPGVSLINAIFVEKSAEVECCFINKKLNEKTICHPACYYCFSK